jgi:hypothetical protein
LFCSLSQIRFHCSIWILKWKSFYFFILYEWARYL